MAVKAQGNGELVRCLNAPAFAVDCHVAVRRLSEALNATILAWQRCHVFQVLFVAPVLEFWVIHAM